MLSRGFVDLHLGVRAGEIVDPFALPETMGVGMQMLSRLCMTAAVEDLGDSVHSLSDTARRLPVGEWGVPQFAAPFRFSEVKLLTTEPVAPTEECRALASKGRPDDAFGRMSIIASCARSCNGSAAESRLQIYSVLRERIVRKPVYERRELSDFLEDEGIVAADEVMRRWSIDIPLGALRRDGSFAICANCGGLLYPHRDANRFPEGRCRIGPCREEVPSSTARRIVEDASGWRVFKDDILAYWVGPGLAEIRLYDELRRGGVDVQLYPRDDAADVGRTNELGIDVKSYSCPRLLGDTLSERLGGLTTFDERYVAIPDAMVNRGRVISRICATPTAARRSVVFAKGQRNRREDCRMRVAPDGFRSGAPRPVDGVRDARHPRTAVPRPARRRCSPGIARSSRILPWPSARIALRNLRLLGVNIESEAHLQEAVTEARAWEEDHSSDDDYVEPPFEISTDPGTGFAIRERVRRNDARRAGMLASLLGVLASRPSRRVCPPITRGDSASASTGTPVRTSSAIRVRSPRCRVPPNCPG